MPTSTPTRLIDTGLLAREQRGKRAYNMVSEAFEELRSVLDLG